MKIKERYSAKKIKIDSLEKALDGLDSVGCSNNGAYLISTGLGGRVYSVFVYNALIYHPNYEQHIKRPETPRRLQDFLYQMFDPFLYKNDERVRSKIDVYQLSSKELKKLEPEGTITKIFQLTMLLYLRSELTEEARKTLKKYSDDTSPIKGTEFCLD